MTLIRDIQFENNPDNREPVETPDIRIPATPDEYTFQPQTTEVDVQPQTPQPTQQADSLTPLRTPVLTQGLPEQNIEAPSGESAFDVVWARASEAAQTAQEWERQRWDSSIDPNLYRVDINGAPPTPSFVQETEQYLIDALGALGNIQGFEPRDQVAQPLNDINPMQNAVSSQQGLTGRERPTRSFRERIGQQFRAVQGMPGLFANSIAQGIARTLYDIPIQSPVEFGQDLVRGLVGAERPADRPRRDLGSVLGLGDHEERERAIQQAFGVDPEDEFTAAAMEQLQPDYGYNSHGDYGNGVIGGANYYLDTWSGGNIIRPWLLDLTNVITGYSDEYTRMESTMSLLEGATLLRPIAQLTGASLIPEIGQFFHGYGGEAARGTEFSFMTPAGQTGIEETPVDPDRRGIRVPSFIVERFGTPEILFEGQTGLGIMTGFVLDTLTELPGDMAWDAMFATVNAARRGGRAGAQVAAEAATETVIPSRALQVMQQGEVHHGLDDFTIQPLTPPTADFSNVPLARLNEGVPEQQLITSRAGRVVREEAEQLSLDLGVMGQQSRMIQDERRAIAQIRDGVDRPFVAENWQGAREPLNVGTVENGTRAQQLVQQQEIDLWNPPEQAAPQAPTTPDLPLRETSETDIRELAFITERPLVDVDELSIYSEGNLSMTAWPMEENHNVLEIGFTVGGRYIRGNAPQLEGGNLRSMIREWRQFANDVQDEYIIVARAGTDDMTEFDMKMRTYQNEGFEFVSQDSWERFIDGEITSHQLEPINPNQAQPSDFMVYRGRNRGGFRRNLQAFGEQRRRLPEQQPQLFGDVDLEDLEPSGIATPSSVLDEGGEPISQQWLNENIQRSAEDAGFSLDEITPLQLGGENNLGFARTPEGLLKVFRDGESVGNTLDAYDIFRGDMQQYVPELRRTGDGWALFEEVPGRNLQQLVESGDDIPSNVWDNITRMLDDMQTNRIVHGDLRTSNIIVLPDGTVKLLDVETASSFPSYDIDSFANDWNDLWGDATARTEAVPNISVLEEWMQRQVDAAAPIEELVDTDYYLGTKAEYPDVPGTVQNYQSARAPYGNGWVLTSLDEAEDYAKAAPANDALIDVPINDVGRVYPVAEVPDRLFDMDAAPDENILASINEYLESNYEPEVARTLRASDSESLAELIQQFDEAMIGLGEDAEVEGQFFRRAIDEALLEEGYNGKRAGNSIITLEPPVLGDGVDVGTGTRLEMLEAQSNIANRMGDPASKVDGARARIEIADSMDEQLAAAEVDLNQKIAETYRELSDRRTVLEDARNAAEADARADFMAEIEFENERTLYDFDDVDEAWECL